MAEKHGDIVTRRDEQLSRQQRSSTSPFWMLDRFADEIDRMFDQFGFGRLRGRSDDMSDFLTWTPRIDVTQRNNELVIHAEDGQQVRLRGGCSAILQIGCALEPRID